MALPPPVILLEAPPFPWRPNLLPMPPEYRYYIDAPDSPSPLSLLDTWARTESYILSPMLRVTHDASSTGSGFAVVTRRPVPQGHALMRVPARLALTADGAVRALPRLLSRELEAHVSIAVWLMRLVEAPPKSLAPYLRSLPSVRDSGASVALHPGSVEARVLQRAGGAWSAVAAQQAMWRRAFARLDELVECGPVNKEEVQMNLATWRSHEGDHVDALRDFDDLWKSADRDLVDGGVGRRRRPAGARARAAARGAERRLASLRMEGAAAGAAALSPCRRVLPETS